MTEALDAARNFESLEGLHLFHSGGSNCSQRVRLMLIEKGLPFEGHVVSIGASEHATPEYQAMNPGGLVPALIHNGRLIGDSIESILYIEKAFPENPMLPEDEVLRQQTLELVNLAGDCQDAIMTLSNEIMFGDKSRKSEEALEAFSSRHQNGMLVSFHSEFSEGGGAWQKRVTQSHEKLEAAMIRLEDVLRQTEFLSGASWGLADIAWAPNVHRMMHLRIPFGKCPHYIDWYGNTRQRESMHEAVFAFEPQTEDISRYEG